MAGIKDFHFVPGFLIGGLFGGLLMFAAVWLGPVATRDAVIEESEQRQFEQAIKLDALKKQSDPEEQL